MHRLKMYSRSYCPYCERAKALLRQAGVEGYEEILIDGREGEMRRKILAMTGRWDVPQIFVDDQYIGDDDALAVLVRSGELRRLLDLAGPAPAGD